MNIWEQSFDDLRRPYLEEKNDGNLANNYPPYDKVTRGDVIAGATGKDQMGGKKKKIKSEERKLGGGMKPGGGYDRGYKAMQKEIEKLESGKEPATTKRYSEMRKEYSDWKSDLGLFTEEDCGSGPMKPKKGIKNKVTINPDLKTEQATTGPVMKPGSGLGGGKLVYPKGQEPKVTGAKLPTLQQAHYEPEGDQIDENPLIGLGVKAGLAAGTALAGKMVFDKAKGVAGKLQQRNQQTQNAINQLRNSFEPEGEDLSEREMTSGEMQKEKKLKKKYDPSDMKASMKKQYGAEKGKEVYFATIRKKAMEQFAGNYEGPLYAPHPDIEEAYKEIDREKESKMYRRAGNLARTSLSSKGKEKEDARNKSAKIVSAITRQKENERFNRIGQSPAHNEEFVDENRMASRMGKMPSAPAKVGKATHSIKDLVPSKKPSPEEKAKARKALGLDEAEGSYGQTPKASAAYGALANKRRNTPASEYPQRGAKKVAVKSAERHMSRSENPDAGNRGKQSTKPHWTSDSRKGMTQKDRNWRRGADEYGHSGYDGEGGGGSLPKGKKLERQRKTGVSEELELDYYLGEALRPASERMKNMQTAAGRKKQEQERTKKSKLEAEADKILAGFSKTGTGTSKTKSTSKTAAPEANRSLKTGQKKDTLAMKANKAMTERREMDEPGEEDWNPEVRRHNKMVGYKPKPKRPSIANDPRYGSVKDK